MRKGPFQAEQFQPTQFSTAEDKADFGNTLLHFIGSDWKRSLFTKNFYTRLSMTFGHIANYDIHGFYSVWFTNDHDRAKFLEATLRWPCYGDPKFTFCDVERAVQREIVARHYHEIYQRRAADELRSAELSLLAQLEAKYRPPASDDSSQTQATSLEPAQVQPLTADPVQGTLFS